MLIGSKAINSNMNSNSSDREISQTLILEARNVVAGYVEGVDILQGANLSVYAGELVTVIGSNGAGKSTLAKAIFGLVPVRSGEILFGDRPIVGLKPEQIVRQGISYVPQVANVFPSLSVSDNLDMGAYTRDGNIKELKDKIYETFPVLAKRRNQRAGTLSGGERQMLAMGRALMLDPQLLILDEPSAALSPILVQDIFNLIQQINQAGTSIILVEQNARKALAIADRGYVMHLGKDEFTGKGADLLNDPEVAELYLGMGNFGKVAPEHVQNSEII
jgi:neutral amino acid transport system ATP-binding protein